MYSPVISLGSGFSSASPDEGTSSTLTLASGFSMTISGVTFLVGEGDFERGAVAVNSGQGEGGVEVSAGDGVGLSTRDGDMSHVDGQDVTYLTR
jgi:hypothetical protein